jgi:1-acyl-sn-glycerol-3-phosphate acyltransferase
MMLRRCRRAVALAFALLMCMVRLAVIRLRGPLSPTARALWLQKSSRRILRSLGIRYRVEGMAPESGLVVSNHLSYLDIAFLAAAMPCAFVSKVEVSKWPYFGVAARAGGTLFIKRGSRASADAVAREIAARLMLGIPILLFPEGTSTDGAEVLRFHSGLYGPAVQAGAPITPVAIRYVAKGGIPERELCWFGDEGFLPHLWKTLRVPGFYAEIVFGEAATYADRRTAAMVTRDEVVRMRFPDLRTSLAGEEKVPAGAETECVGNSAKAS